MIITPIVELKDTFISFKEAPISMKLINNGFAEDLPSKMYF